MFIARSIAMMPMPMMKANAIDVHASMASRADQRDTTTHVRRMNGR
jgi:hypothetical protein